MIKEITNNEILEFAKKYFPDYKESSNPYEKIYGYYDKEILGFISISIIYERCEINYIAVKEEYRRKGIAQKLFDYINHNFQNISLEVRKDNEKAINFYKKNGFKIVATRKNYYGNIDGYLMVKEMR